MQLEKQLLEGDAFKISEGSSCVAFFDGTIAWCSRMFCEPRKKKAAGATVNVRTTP